MNFSKKNNLLLHILGAFTILLPATTLAEVTLLVDDNIKVTAINGNEIKQSLLQPLQKKFTLKAGKHVITAKYDRLFDLRNDEHDYLRSANVSVGAELQDHQTYRLIMPNQPNDYKSAKQYAKQPTLAIQKDDKIISEQQSLNSSNGGMFSGIGSAISGIFNRGDNAQMVNQKAIDALENQSTSNAENNSTLDQFMQLWLKATPNEREKIRQWVKQE